MDSDALDVMAHHQAIARLRPELDKIAFELKYRRLMRKAGFNPDQPRVPAGRHEGGRWTREGGLAAALGQEFTSEEGEEASTEGSSLDGVQFAEASTGTLTDADGTPYYKPGGHHEMPKGIYEKWDLPPETEKVFREATTGRIPPAAIRMTPDGEPIGNFWGKAHRDYNDAIGELASRFLERNNIGPQQMTPDQARDLLKEIRESDDPRIRNFNNALRVLRRVFPLRGRGNE